MKKRSFYNIFILIIVVILSIYCIKNLIVVDEAFVQIEHKEPLSIVSQKAVNIQTENNDNGYITNIILPSAIFTRHEQIKIKSDIKQTVFLKLSGPKVAYKDSYKKYKIVYDKISVDGDIISPNVTASFLDPFSYHIENISNFIIEFDYKTGFVLRNMSYICLMGFVIILLFIMYLGYVKGYPAKIRDLCCRCDSSDFLFLFINGYKNIKREYKIAFWANFILLNLVYLYLNSNFLYGDHDVNFFNIDNILIYAEVGRFSIGIINTLLTESKYLPFINNWLAFTFLALTPIFLVIYWKLPRTIYNMFALSVLLFFHPQLLSVLYFLHLSYAYMLAPLLIVLALILSEKKGGSAFVFSVALLVFAFGDYNVCINTLAVIFLGKMLIEYSNGNSFIGLLKKYFRSICVILMSCVVYYLITQYLKYIGIFVDAYNTRLLAADQILPRILTVFVEAFKQFYVTYPFVDLKYLILLSLLCILMVIVMLNESIRKKNIWHFFACVFIFIILIFGSKIIYCLTRSNGTLGVYVYYFSFPYVYTCSIAYILNSRILWGKNILFVLLVPICFLSIIRDLEYQKYWKIGFDGDTISFSRVVDRIENSDNFTYKNKYDFIGIGYFNSFNSYYYRKQTDSTNLAVTNPFVNCGFKNSIPYYMPGIKVKSNKFITSKISSDDEVKEVFSDIPQEKIFSLKPWPHKNSVVIYENKIIICWQEKELEYVKKVLAEQPESHAGEE